MEIKKLKEEIIKQKNSKFKGNIYHYSQVNFAYNSNKIEGSILTEEQTEAIYETASFIPKTEALIKLDDIIETKNHFKLFDYIIDNIDKTLSIDMILEMHRILKKGTTDEDNPLFNVGGFKIAPNIIGAISETETTQPKNIELELNYLLKKYTQMEDITLEDIIEFHYNFEKIHPFADGNGRIGRIIMFKECLKNNIIPFIILDKNKNFYLRGLKEYKKGKTYLIDTIKYSQDIYEEICNKLLDY